VVWYGWYGRTDTETTLEEHTISNVNQRKMQTSIQLWILVLCLAYTLVSSATTDECREAAKKSVDQLFKEFWEWKLLNNPQFATKIGISKYDDRLTELSLSSYKRRSDAVRMLLAKLRNVTADIDLNEDHALALNIDLFASDLVQYISGMRFKTYLWPINNMEGPQNDYIKLISMMRRSSAEDVRKIIIRMRLFSQQMDEMIALLREGMRQNLTLNSRSFKKLIGQYGKLATMDIARNPFFKSFKKRPKNITGNVWKLLINDAKTTILKYIQPSFKKLQMFLKDEYLAKSRPDIGVSSLSHGEEYYQGCLQYHTTTNLTPKEIHEIGLKEVERIRGRMEEVKTKVKFNGSLADFNRHLRSDERFGFKDEDEILSYYRGIEHKVRKLLPYYVSKIPTLKFVIRPFPKEIAPTAPFGYYDEPSSDGRIPGIFWVNTYKPQKRRKYIATSLFLHEALPGHHIQIASKIEFGSPVLFRRYMGMDVSYYEAPACFSRNSAYTEGWGLYAEYLGEEMGLYSNPYDLFGRLSQEMLRAARLVVDTGMHALRWSRSRAIQFMATYTAGNMHDIEAEIDRYISWPGQACSYKIGELKIRELRELAEDKLGKKFDVKKFHAFIISTGNIPLTILEKEFKLYLKKEIGS